MRSRRRPDCFHAFGANASFAHGPRPSRPGSVGTVERCLACEAVVSGAVPLQIIPFPWLHSVSHRFRALTATELASTRSASVDPVRTVDDRGQHEEGHYLMMFPCSPRPRKRGSAPRPPLTPPSRSLQDCAVCRRRSRVRPQDNRQRAAAGRQSGSAKQSPGISECK
jgi:hypothetical protein